MVHEGAWTVIDGLAGYRGVVGIHDAVDETDQQPARDEIGLTCDHSVQKGMIGAIGMYQIGAVPADHVIRQPPHALGFATRRKIMERSATNVAGRPTGENSAKQPGLAADALA